MYDVVVVGGNLSGSSAAINAVEKDVKVALIERRRKPYFPAHCGEFIPDVTANWFNLEKISCSQNFVDKVIINVASKRYRFLLKNHSLVVFDRNFFERYLQKRLQKSDVNVFFGKNVINFNPPNKILLSDNNSIKGKTIIDATGIACKIGKKAGVNTKIKRKDVGVCIQSRVQGDFDSDKIYFWFHKPYAPLGYAWFFPVNDHLANIGLGVAGGQNLDLSRLLKKYIKDMTDNNYKILSTFQDCVPQAPPLDSLVKKNVLITGDAGRLTDPPTGAGIQTAVFSGTLAGIIAKKYIKGELESLHPYQRYMRYKTSKLKKSYKRKNKAYRNEKKFVKKYTQGISFLHWFHKLFPNLSEKMIERRVKKDIKIIDSVKSK